MSWRVAILPYLDEAPLYQQYDPQQPWNSPKNSAVSDDFSTLTVARAIRRVSESRETSYVMLVGPGTVGGLEGGRYFETAPGTSHTILLVEAPNSGIQWAEPRDLTIDEFIERVKSHKGGNHPGRILVAFCDGSVHFIRADVSPDVLRALADPNREKPTADSEWE